MLKICLVFWESEPQYAYKLYAYKKKHVIDPPPKIREGGVRKHFPPLNQLGYSLATF